MEQSSFSLDPEANTSISITPTTDEIWNVVQKMNSYGSPGPDGYPVVFYKKCWSIIGEDTTKYVQQIFTSGAIPMDMLKAYDRVFWSLLDYMLHQMGIHNQSHNLIMNCVTSSTFSILLNGAPYGNFASGRGLRQRFPLSPSLFIIYSQWLSLLMEKFENTSLYSGYGFNAHSPVIGHLIYMTIQKLGVNEMQIEEKYLGTYLLKWGELSKSVLSTIPNYSLGNCILPKGVTNKLSPTQRAFYWGHDVHTRKQHFFIWEKAMKPKEDGGLGIQNMELPMPGDSNTWKDMLEVIDILLNNCYWFIGSRYSIHIWNDPWVLHIPGFRPTKLQSSNIQVTWVSDLFIQGVKSWDIDFLTEIFPQDQVDIISSIYIPQEEEVQDNLIWLKTPSGKLTAKSSYNLLSDNIPVNSLVAAFPWKQFWKMIKIQPKIQNFLQKALHEGLEVYTNMKISNHQFHNICHANPILIKIQGVNILQTVFFLL
ncbi:uncharacterized protein LOC113333617 [Papaver somniferum]|uniref:uncharacterized protein LOC113333617 n=1 Tax=Papaver somniferum TaxID=3469 RepID=UPI000E701445|nr:uncharacterized protein LOC113333617 [Papaver somniferum]